MNDPRYVRAHQELKEMTEKLEHLRSLMEKYQRSEMQEMIQSIIGKSPAELTPFERKVVLDALPVSRAMKELDAYREELELTLQEFRRSRHLRLIDP